MVALLFSNKQQATMSNDYTPNRWEEIQTLHTENRTLYQILGGVALIAGGVILGAIMFSGDAGYPTNLFTEILSLGVTVFVLNLLAKRREDSVLKGRLLQQLGSSFNFVALTALEEIQYRGWLQDGSLAGTNLSQADLRGADFSKANLTHVAFASRRYGHAQLDANTRLPDETFWQENYDMHYLDRFTDPDHPQYWRGFGLREANLTRRNFAGANLRGADMYQCNLWGANLEGANLRQVVLHHARLRQAKLSGADLIQGELDHADMRQADLRNANLAGADLYGVNLEGANLSGANINDARLLDVILPNGETYVVGMNLGVYGLQGTPRPNDAELGLENYDF